MSTLLIQALTAGLLAKDIFTNKKGEIVAPNPQAQPKKGLGFFPTLLIAGTGAYFAGKLYDNYVKDKSLSEVGSNTPDGLATQFAIQLEDAFHPFGKLPFGIPDGTDEKAVENIARQVALNKLGQKVSDKYFLLYNKSLASELQSEGVFDLYFNIVNGSGGGGTSPGGGSGGGTQPGTSALKAGDTVYTYGGYNIRNLSDNSVNRVSTAGQKWFVKSWKTETIGGVTDTFVVITQDQFFFYKIWIKGLYKK